MRAAAIFGLGSHLRDLKPYQQDAAIQWTIGLPAEQEKLDAVLIFGGDGTVHRHLPALLKLGVPVLVVPAGSGNDFARALGISNVRDSLSAWKGFVSVANKIRTVDLGTITALEKPSTTTYFCCAAGVGLDGEIARRANALPRWLRAHGGYAFSLPPALMQFRAFVLKLSVAQGRPEEFCLRSHQPVLAAVFANTPVYGGGMKVAPTAKMDDGLFDISRAIVGVARQTGLISSGRWLIWRYALAVYESKLRRLLGTKVRILPKGKGGVIELSYFSDEELERLMEWIASKK